MQVFGDHPSEFLYALAGFEEHGDRDGWNRFLANAAHVFLEYGDIPFVHWHDYEKNKLALYVERFGDSDGIADRVKGNLLDLLPLTQAAVSRLSGHAFCHFLTLLTVFGAWEESSGKSRLGQFRIQENRVRLTTRGGKNDA